MHECVARRGTEDFPVLKTKTWCGVIWWCASYDCTGAQTRLTSQFTISEVHGAVYMYSCGQGCPNFPRRVPYMCADLLQTSVIFAYVCGRFLVFAVCAQFGVFCSSSFFSARHTSGKPVTRLDVYPKQYSIVVVLIS